MSLGDTLTQAKRLGVGANEELMISEKIRDKVASKIKADKAGELHNAYKLQEIREEKPEHKSFLDNFRKRNED